MTCLHPLFPSKVLLFWEGLVWRVRSRSAHVHGNKRTVNIMDAGTGLMHGKRNKAGALISLSGDVRTDVGGKNRSRSSSAVGKFSHLLRLFLVV